MIYWFIGQPGCGKTTLAKKLKQELDFEAAEKVIHFDGDDLRKIFGDKGYAPISFEKEQRIQETQKLQRLISYIADQGIDVIVSTVNIYRDVREEFKKSRDDVMEIYVINSGNHVREEYHQNAFEPPLENFFLIDTNGLTPEQSMDILWKQI